MEIFIIKRITTSISLILIILLSITISVHATDVPRESLPEKNDRESCHTNRKISKHPLTIAGDSER